MVSLISAFGDFILSSSKGPPIWKHCKGIGRGSEVQSYACLIGCFIIPCVIDKEGLDPDLSHIVLRREK